tara:strand:- start:206 stop:844 length:639 start_codon:yes stop_codon:yes gene_type:complete
MPELSFVSWIEAVGYAAGAVTMWGMYRKTMIPLRLGAIFGNVGFIAFGLLTPSYPTLVLHALVLPLNTLRLFQMMRLVREIKESSGGDNSLEPLLPYMSSERTKAGEVLFRIGDSPKRMIVIKSGTVLLEEIGARCSDGDVLGEIGAFTPDNRRTCTAVCETDCELYTLTHEAMMQLYYQNPRFGMFLVRVIVRRLLDNWQDADARAKSMLA